MTPPVSGGVREPAECELEAIAALLESAEKHRAALWGGPSYGQVARWLFDHGVRIQDGAALERPRPALPASSVANDLTGKPLKWVVQKCDNNDESQGFYVLLPDTGHYWFAREREAAAHAFCKKLNGAALPAEHAPPDVAIDHD